MSPKGQRLRQYLARLRRFGSRAKTAIRLLLAGELELLAARLLEVAGVRRIQYEKWVKRNDTLGLLDRQRIRARIASRPSWPLISVLMPVYNPEPRWLERAIESVRSQLYPNWELCIADDHSTDPRIGKLLQEYAARDDRIRVILRPHNGHISEASNSALELVRGEFVALMDHDDELPHHALYCIAEALEAHPEADLIYSDEDKIDTQNNRFDPHFKSDWSPDLFRSYNMISHLGVYRTSLVRSLGGFRKGFEGSQDYDLALRMIEHTKPGNIIHIPRVLYHWRAIGGSTALAHDEKGYVVETARRALQEHLARQGIKGRVVEGFGPYHRVIYDLPDPVPLVTLIICTRDGVELLRQIVDGVLHETDYPRYEILIMDNQSCKPETLAYFEELRRSDVPVTILRYDLPFNFSAMNNLGARHAKGDVLVLMNNDLKVIDRDWLRELVTQALRPEVGAVGAKLYFGNDTIQHAGVVLGIGGGVLEDGGVAGHAHKFLPRSSGGYMARAKVVQNFSAVTAACIAIRKNVFEEVGGLDERNLAVAFNDIDLCLRIREKGYWIVWTPYAELYHLESVTRGSDNSPEQLPRFRREFRYMRERWGAVLDRDPFYSANLTLEHEDFSLARVSRAPKPWVMAGR